jgi:NADH:ubiquinone oxidoreductase subunit 4 (subunit M)
MLQRVVFGPLREPPDQHAVDHASTHRTPVRPVGWHEIAGLTPLMALIVLIGVYPKPIFDRVRPAVQPIAARFHRDLPVRNQGGPFDPSQFRMAAHTIDSERRDSLR